MIAYVIERNEFLRDLENKTDKNLDEYCIKHNIKILTNRLCMWAGLHKARIELFNSPYQMGAITEEMAELSRKWLKDNRFNEGIL